MIIIDDKLYNGSADYLRAVSDRIHGDFICLHTDFISQYTLGELASMHKLNCSDITMLLTISSKDLKLDESDEEIIGICDDGRIVLKLLKLEVAETLTIHKALLHHAPTLSLRQDLIDIGIYFISYWIIKFLLDNIKMTSIKRDLIPYLMQRQFLSSNHIMKMIPSIKQYRYNRSLYGIESWIINNNNNNYSINRSTYDDNNDDNNNYNYHDDNDDCGSMNDKNKVLYDSLFINHNRQRNDNSDVDDNNNNNNNNNININNHTSSNKNISCDGNDDDNNMNSYSNKKYNNADVLRCYGMVYNHVQYSNKINFNIDDNSSVSNISINLMSSSNGMLTNNPLQSVSSIMLSRLFNIPIYLQMNR